MNTVPDVVTFGTSTGIAAPVLRPPFSGIASNSVDSLASSLSLVSLVNTSLPPPLVNPSMPPPLVNPLVPPRPFCTSDIFGASLLLPGYPAYSAVPTFNPLHTGALFAGQYDPAGLLNSATAFYQGPSGLLPSLSALNYQLFVPGRPL